MLLALVVLGTVDCAQPSATVGVDDALVEFGMVVCVLSISTAGILDAVVGLIKHDM